MVYTHLAGRLTATLARPAGVRALNAAVGAMLLVLAVGLGVAH